jgi:hypothetical protein
LRQRIGGSLCQVLVNIEIKCKSSDNGIRDSIKVIVVEKPDSQKAKTGLF